MNGEWPNETVTRLRELWSLGTPASEIGRQIGYSKGAVIGKAHRLKLPQREAIHLHGGHRKTPPIPGNVILFPRAAASTPRKVPVAPKPRSLAPSVSKRACVWPIGEPGKPGFHFCGDAALEGKPYCAEHCRKAYVRRDR